MTAPSIYDFRRANLQRLLAERGAKTALAERLGSTQAFVSHLVRDPQKDNARQIHEDVARKIEVALLLQPGELDNPPGEISHIHPLQAVDWDLLMLASSVVSQTAQANGIALTAEQHRRITGTVYKVAPESGGPTSPAVRMLVSSMLRI